MNLRSGKGWLKLFVYIMAALIAGAFIHPASRLFVQPFPHSLKATLDQSFTKMKGLALVGGYNYRLLKDFTSTHNAKVNIRMADKTENAIDSLDAMRTDIVILPFPDSLRADSTHIAIPVDSAGIWLFRKGDRLNAVRMVHWLERYRKGDKYRDIRERYMGMYDPTKHTDCKFISPYDSLVRAYADTLGWDWRLLGAMIYCESHFKIEARSPKGASGLMQVMPSVASRKGHEDLLDPEANIKAGTDILLGIQKKYRLWGTPEERIKYALASYNAGPGKVRKCVDHAIELGVDPNLWDNVASLVPTDPLDTAQTAQYLSQETVGYVRHILYLYNRYRKICPEK